MYVPHSYMILITRMVNLIFDSIWGSIRISLSLSQIPIYVNN